jgi:hypothetical protein
MEDHIKELFNDVFHLESKLFMTTDSYRLFEQKCDKNCLNPGERQQLNMEIQDVFKRLIRIIKKSCPNITDEDILFCCLKRAGFDNLIAGHCIGSVGRQSVNQRKYRIKKKMESSNCHHRKRSANVS